MIGVLGAALLISLLAGLLCLGVGLSAEKLERSLVDRVSERVLNAFAKFRDGCFVGAAGCGAFFVLFAILVVIISIVHGLIMLI